jgi:hypothetical protein
MARRTVYDFRAFQLGGDANTDNCHNPKYVSLFLPVQNFFGSSLFQVGKGKLSFPAMR